MPCFLLFNMPLKRKAFLFNSIFQVREHEKAETALKKNNVQLYIKLR